MNAFILVRTMAEESESFWLDASRDSRSAWLTWEARRKALLLRSWSKDRKHLAKKILKLRNPYQISFAEACREFPPPRFPCRQLHAPSVRARRLHRNLPASR